MKQDLDRRTSWLGGKGGDARGLQPLLLLKLCNLSGKTLMIRAMTLKATGTRYAQMEKEMLVIVFAVEKFNNYTFGNKTIVFSDHKPLESILKKPLHLAPKRLQGMIIRLQKYDLEVRYEKGRKSNVPSIIFP